jgi:hypothetical protein
MRMQLNGPYLHCLRRIRAPNYFCNRPAISKYREKRVSNAGNCGNESGLNGVLRGELW